MIAKYYEESERQKKLIRKVEHYSFYEGRMFDFFICLFIKQQFRCRDPPSVNLILRISN